MKKRKRKRKRDRIHCPEKGGERNQVKREEEVHQAILIELNICVL